MADRDIDIAVDRMGHDRMQDDIDAHGGELPGCLGKPDIIAVEDAEFADAIDIESEEFLACLNPLLQWQERKHLAIASDNLAFRIEDRSGVVDGAVAALIHGAVDDPDTVMVRDVAERILRGAGQWLRILQQWPIASEFGEHDQLHPGKQMHGQIDALAHGINIGTVTQLHLNAGNGKRRHARLTSLKNSLRNVIEFPA